MWQPNALKQILISLRGEVQTFFPNLNITLENGIFENGAGTTHLGLVLKPRMDGSLTSVNGSQDILEIGVEVFICIGLNALGSETTNIDRITKAADICSYFSDNTIKNFYRILDVSSLTHTYLNTYTGDIYKFNLTLETNYNDYIKFIKRR